MVQSNSTASLNYFTKLTLFILKIKQFTAIVKQEPGCS